MSTQHTEHDAKIDSRTPREAEWLCVMCKTQQENTAEDNLKRQGFKVYLPIVPNTARKQSRVTKIIKAMFPGYLLIKADLRRHDLSVIRSTIGCIALLRQGVHPAFVPKQVMASIKEVEAVLQNQFDGDQGFTPGARYELLEQGFQGHTATFLALEGKERARVLVTLLNSEQEVRVPTHRLSPQIS